ncbi:hypothetical protein [Martelella endophytica]|uniref:Uncharacterized protein n=1 Tax=Martelella endophytica TaxID=1486262 RepID=A0A0D5LKF5_MAREN|nr:hypothetical protein [Martelella endophytica]AJY44679.1 hypothetical protein TM49_01660 [Martelella endophytica]
MAEQKRFYVITDDAPWACLAVFGIGLYGLPDWAEVVDTSQGIDAIPSGSRYRACWHFETSNSRYMQRLVTERWAARELIAATEEFMDRLETKIAERDRVPSGPADDTISGVRADVVIVDEHHHQPKRERANKWH